MLLCCITLSSSRENQRMLKRWQEGFLAPLPGRLTPSQVKSRHTKYPSQTLIPRITLFVVCLSFSSPPLQLCLFSAFFPYVFLFVFPCALFLLASLLAKNLLIWIHLKYSTWIIFDPFVLVMKPQLA